MRWPLSRDRPLSVTLNVTQRVAFGTQAGFLVGFIDGRHNCHTYKMLINLCCPVGTDLKRHGIGSSGKLLYSLGVTLLKYTQQCPGGKLAPPQLPVNTPYLGLCRDLNQRPAGSRAKWPLTELLLPMGTLVKDK